MAWLAKSSSTGSVRFGLGPCSQPPRSAPKNQRLQERQGAHQPACGTEILKLLDVRARQMQLRSYVTEPTVDIRRGLCEACGRKAAKAASARPATPSRAGPVAAPRSGPGPIAPGSPGPDRQGRIARARSPGPDRQGQIAGGQIAGARSPGPDHEGEIRARSPGPVRHGQHCPQGPERAYSLSPTPDCHRHRRRALPGGVSMCFSSLAQPAPRRLPACRRCPAEVNGSAHRENHRPQPRDLPPHADPPFASTRRYGRME